MTDYYPHPRTPPKLLQYARELRHPQTPAEQKLWSRLRNRQLNGLKLPMSDATRRWAAWRRRRPKADKLLIFALIWPCANLVLMAANGMVCPLQDWAQALSGQHEGWVRDIYWIPESWLRLVPWTYSTSYVLGLVLVFARIRKQASKPAPPPHRASP